MRKVLIIEDNPVSMELICKMLGDIDPDVSIFKAYDAGAAYQQAMEHSIDLFIVDIVLEVNVPGDVSGMVFADRIRTIKKYEFVPLIFITSLEDPKLHAYTRLHCYMYIEKPFDLEETETVIRKALEFPNAPEKKEFIYFRKDGILYSRKLDEIICIESIYKKVTIYSANDELIIPYKSCNELLRDLDSDLFILCNRSTIVNKKYIDYVDTGNRLVGLKSLNKSVELGIIMKKRFLKALENES